MNQPDYRDKSRPLLFWVIGTLLGACLLQYFIQVWFGDVSLWRNWVAASRENVLGGKVWTLFTYALAHGGVWHLLFNALLIFFIGRLLVSMVGERAVLRCLLGSVLAGGLLWFGVHAFGGNAALMGASAGALGLLFLFCCLRPNQPITLLLFFVIPVTLKPKWIAWVLLGMDLFGLLFSEMPVAFGVSEGLAMAPVAYSAHLGGMLIGYLYARHLQRPAAVQSRSAGVRIEMPEWMRNKRAKAGAVRYKVNVGGKTANPAVPASPQEIDRILDKINREGFGSLDEQERRHLDQAGERFRR